MPVPINEWIVMKILTKIFKTRWQIHYDNRFRNPKKFGEQIVVKSIIFDQVENHEFSWFFQSTV